MFVAKAESCSKAEQFGKSRLAFFAFHKTIKLTKCARTVCGHHGLCNKILGPLLVMSHRQETESFRCTSAFHYELHTVTPLRVPESIVNFTLNSTARTQWIEILTIVWIP